MHLNVPWMDGYLVPGMGTSMDYGRSDTQIKSIKCLGRGAITRVCIWKQVGKETHPEIRHGIACIWRQKLSCLLKTKV